MAQIRVTRGTWNLLAGAALATFGVTRKRQILNHAPVGCWGPKDVPVAVEQSSGRDRLNIHGAINLETGQTVMKDVLTVDAASTIMLLMAIEAMFPDKRQLHVFLDNARYHHAKLVQAWLARPGCRIRLHFVPA